MGKRGGNKERERKERARAKERDIPITSINKLNRVTVIKLDFIIALRKEHTTKQYKYSI